MKIIVLGVGGRGRHYLNFSLNEGLEVVAIADNNEARMASVVQDSWFSVNTVPIPTAR